VHRRANGTCYPVEVHLQLVEQDGQRIFLAVILDITERKLAEEALHELTGRLLRLQDEERRRIGRELHDSTAQALAALEVNLSLVHKAADALATQPRELLAESVGLAQQCSNEIRTVAYLLHPPLLDELGLASALRWHVEGFAKRSGIRVDLDLPEQMERLSAEHELALFRVARESLANVHRHSGSQTAAICLRPEAGRVALEVSDSGRGMPEPVLRSFAANAGTFGVGLSGMRERLRQLGGHLELESGPGGTRVRAVLKMGEG